MVKPTPDPPVVNLPPDHPLFHFPSDFSETDGNVLAERFRRQRALMEQARKMRNARVGRHGAFGSSGGNRPQRGNCRQRPLPQLRSSKGV